jgi:hypothetical protein
MANEFLHQRHAEENKGLRGAFLAGAPAAIAFAFHETVDRELAWSLLPILLAVLAWGASFAAGIWASRTVQVSIKANLLMNEAKAAGDKHGYDAAVDLGNKASDTCWNWQQAQMWCLFAGAALYLIGHVWHIVATSSAPLAAA